MVALDIELPHGSKADLAKRLFAHIENKATDLADSTMRVDHREYLDPELAAREREAIFGRVPVVAVHGSEMPEPNDFMVTQLPNNEVLLVRQRDGAVKAFVNVCRHRGARLVPQDSGSRKMFTCGYHGWSYGPDGALRVVSGANTFGEVDRSCHGLVELSCEERHGLVWVIDSRGATMNLGEWLGRELDETLRAYELSEYLCYRVGTFDEPINWKVLVDGFLDSYHISDTHAKSVAPYFYSNTQVFDRIGRHGRAISPRRTIDAFLSEPPESVPIEKHVTIGYSFMPNMVLLRQPDHFQLLNFLPHPTDAQRCRMQIRLLIREPAETERQRAFWDKNWKILMDVLRDEDMTLNRDLQHALSSRDAESLVFGRNEIVNQWFHTWLAGALRDPPDFG
ncbi:MAG: hypothetical protein QOC83_6478 [Pseudonocardiales bacterium]|nr:hypothetical protein [Pseudonocardiales bacterium]